MGKVQDELRLYNKVVLDHFMNPRNVGSLDNASVTVTIKNPHCGDIIKLSLTIDANLVKSAMVKTFACTIAIASSSIMTTMVRGMSLDQLSSVTQDDIINWLGGVPEMKRRCTITAQKAIQEAVLVLRK